MCFGSPKVAPVPTPPPVPAPVSSPVGDEVAPRLKTGDDKLSEEKRLAKVRRRGTKSLQTTSGLNIPTSGSGLNIS